MKSSNFQIIIYSLVGIMICICIWVGYNIIFSSSAKPIIEEKEKAKPKLVEDSIEIYKEPELPEKLGCVNFKTNEELRINAVEMVNNLGSKLSNLANKKEFTEARRRSFVKSIRKHFENPTSNEIEIILSYENPTVKQFTVDEYLDYLLRNENRSYKIYWIIDEYVSKFEKIANDKYRTSINIVQVLTREELEGDRMVKEWIEKYGDRTTKKIEIALIIGNNGQCEDLNSSNNTFEEYCCFIKLGNIKAIKAEKLNQILN